jgi:hypothetical protein
LLLPLLYMSGIVLCRTALNELASWILIHPSCSPLAHIDTIWTTMRA